MTNKNSNSLRCRQCGVVNWATDEFCRRCQQSLHNSSAQTESGDSPNRFYIYLTIFIAALAIPILVSRADPETGDNLGMVFVVGAYGLAFSCKFLLIFQMFRVSILWGVTGIFLAPLSTLLFMGKYWERAKKPVFTCLTAVLYIFIMIIGVGQITKPKVAQNSAKPQPTPLTSYLDQAPTPRPDFLPPRANEANRKLPKK